MDKVDFLPDRIKCQRSRRSRLLRQGYLLGACLAALGVLAYVRDGRISQTKAELALLDERVSEMRNQLVLRTSLEQQMADLMVKRRIVEHLGSRTGPLDVMAGLDQLLPESVVLTGLNMETMDVRVPVRRPGDVNAGLRATAAGAAASSESAVKRVRLTITGLAPTDADLGNFILQLSACPLFEDVNMGYTKNVDFRGRPARQFLVSCYVVR
jgi:Tfp pilus assembly protein PilN